MISKSGHGFSEKIMLKQQAKEKYRSTQNYFALSAPSPARAKAHI
jgi:hypothetical protein